jgi:hypothetical protein
MKLTTEHGNIELTEAQAEIVGVLLFSKFREFQAGA